jgi:hypothetical protein
MMLSGYGLAVESGLAGGVAFFFPPFTCGFEFAVTCREDFFVPSFELGLWRDVAEGRVQAYRVVVIDELGDDASGVFQGQGRTGADTFFLEDTMPAFDLAVTLGVIRRGSGVRHATEADELLEVAGDKLRAVIGDDPRRHAGEFLPRPLDDLLDVSLGHGFADLPVDREPATTIEQAAQVVERASDVDIRDIDMPVFMRVQRLDETLALGRGLGRGAVEQPGRLEDAVDAGRATGDDVLVEHHEGQAPVALQREQRVEVADGLLFLGLEPVVAWDPGVVFVGLAVAVLPGVPLGGGQAEPQQEASDGKGGVVGPAVDEINDLVAGVVGNPESV